jgi:hypothetical protein
MVSKGSTRYKGAGILDMTLPKVSGDCRMAQPINARKPSQTQTSVVSEPNTTRLVNAGFWLTPELRFVITAMKNPQKNVANST